MTEIYIPYFLIACVIGILASMISPASITEHELPEIARKNSDNSALWGVIFIIIGMFSAFRQVFAGSIDEYAYRNRFDALRLLNFNEVLEQTEVLYYLPTWGTAQFFQTNQGILIVSGILTVWLFIYAIKKYALDYNYALLLFFVIGTLWSTFNGVQQYIAAALFFLNFKYLYKKQFGHFFMLVTACFFIHTASIFLLPIYFMANMKLGTAKMWCTYVIFATMLIIFYKSLSFFIPYIDSLQSYSRSARGEHHGVILITILINIMPSVIVLMFLKKIQHAEDQITEACACMVFIHAIIMCVSALDVYIARLTYFTGPFVILFLARLQSILQHGEYQIIKYSSILLYSIVTFLLMRNSYYVFNFTL